MKKDKRGLYRTQVTINGKRKVFTSKNKQALMLKVANYKEATTSPNFGDVADQWHTKHFDEIRYGSWRGLNAPYKRILEAFQEKNIDEISTRDVQNFFLRQSETYAKKTIVNTKTVLNAIFRFAVLDLNLDIQNPCSMVQLPRNLRSSSREPLTEEQLKEVLNTGPDEFLLAPLILYTGTRCGEALAIQWKDIDWENDTISITKDIDHQGNQPVIDSLKTQKALRTVPLLPQLKKLLTGQIYRHSDDFIVSGEKPLTKSQLRCRWKAWCKAHDLLIDGKPAIDRHQIRHQFATFLFEANISAKDAQDILGHADIQTTMNIYTHISEKRRKETTEKLAAYFETK